MIKRANEHKHEVSENVFGGSGEIHFDRIIETPEELMGKGRVYSVCTLPTGSELGWHVHNGDCEFYHIISGSAEYSDNGRISTLSAGDSSFTPSGEGHSIKNISPEPCVFIALIVYC